MSFQPLPLNNDKDAVKVDIDNQPINVDVTEQTYTDNGFQKVTIFDESGATNIIGVFGEQLATGIRDDILCQFQYGISTYDVVTSTVGTGAVTNVDHKVQCATGTDTNGEAKVYSVDTLRYRPGHTAVCHFTAAFHNGGVAGCTQYVGILNGEDGIYFGYNGADQVVGIRNDGSDTQVLSTAFNGADISGVDFTNLNVFRIKFGWLGIAPITIQVLENGGTRWLDVHTFELQGTQKEPHIGNPVLPIEIHVKKTSGATNVVVSSASWQAGAFGNDEITASSRPFSDAQVYSSVDATPRLIASYQSKTTFASKTNKIRAQLLRYQFHVDTPGTGTGTIRVRLIGNPTYGGAASYASIDASNSVLEVDTAQTYTSGGTVALTEWINYSATNKGGTVSGSITNAAELGLYLNPGNNFAVVADVVDGTGTPNVRATFNWVELF